MTTSPTPAAPAPGALSSKLLEMKKRTEAITSAGASQTLQERLAALSQRTSKVAAAPDAAERGAKLGLASADFKQARALIAADQRDLVLLIEDYNTLLSSLSDQHAQLSQPNERELATVKAAEDNVTRAKAATLETGIIARFKSKGRKAALAEAEQALERAKQNIHVAMRQRLKEANTAESMQEIMNVVRNLETMLEGRLVTTDEQLSSSELFRAKVQDDIVALGAEADALATMRTQTLQSVTRKEAELADAVQGGEVAAKLEKEVADLRAELQNIEGRQTVVLSTSRTTQTFAAEHAQQEKSLRDAKIGLENYLSQLKVTLENRAQTVSAMMELELSFSDVDAASTMMNVSDQVSERHMNRSAVISASILNSIQKDAQSAPAKLAKKKEILEASLKHSREHTAALQQCLADMASETPLAPGVALSA